MTATRALTIPHTPIETSFHFGVSNSFSFEAEGGFMTWGYSFLLFAGKDMRGLLYRGQGWVVYHNG
jgi:hypothetical protein